MSTIQITDEVVGQMVDRIMNEFDSFDPLDYILMDDMSKEYEKKYIDFIVSMFICLCVLTTVEKFSEQDELNILEKYKQDAKENFAPEGFPYGAESIQDLIYKLLQRIRGMNRNALWRYD